MHRILKPTGSIYLHCDPTMSHYLKLLMDAIWGRKNFKSEVVWSHQGSWIQPENNYPRRHDTLLYYINGGEAFNLGYDDNYEDRVNYKRWKKYFVRDEIYGRNMPDHDKRFGVYFDRFKNDNGREPEPDDVVMRIRGERLGTVRFGG